MLSGLLLIVFFVCFPPLTPSLPSLPTPPQPSNLSNKQCSALCHPARGRHLGVVYLLFKRCVSPLLPEPPPCNSSLKPQTTILPTSQIPEQRAEMSAGWSAQFICRLSHLSKCSQQPHQHRERIAHYFLGKLLPVPMHLIRSLTEL